MAEPGSHSINTTAASAAPQQDWEVLSMSMSASAFGNSNSAGDGKTGKLENPYSQIDTPTSQIKNPNLLVENPTSALGNLSPSSVYGASSSEMAAAPWTDPFHAGGSSDCCDKITEPFTEGWKPHLSTSANLHGYGAEHGYGEGDTRSFNQSTEPPLQKETVTVASKDFCVIEKEASESEKRDLSGLYSDVVDVDQAPKKKVRKGHGWWKRPRKSKAMWSIAVAAAVVGIVVLGHSWQLERCHNQQLRLELSAKDEKLNDLTYQVSRLKEVLGGYRKAAVMTSSSF